MQPLERRGLVLGKFLPYHAGHAHLIRSAYAQVDQLTVLVCSIPGEPISGELRHRWVSAAHPECRVIHVAEDVPQAPSDDPRFWPIWVDLIRRYAGAVDIVFTSEDYGDELARHLGARHVSVDRNRENFAVSGTAVRRDPLAHWKFLTPAVRAYYALRIAILGAESTGKTTLAGRLATRFQTVWVPEFGRDYCLARQALELTHRDFEAIARGQIALEEDHARHANRILICDTELHTTAVWSDLVTGSRPPWLPAAADSRKYDLFLLLADDVPWEDDGTRVLRDRRAEHTGRLRAELERARRQYQLLEGSFDTREAEAVRLIEALVSSTSTVVPREKVTG